MTFTPDPRKGVTHDQARKVLWASGGCCHWCGRPINLVRETMDSDHVIPLALGGKDDWSNIRAIHRVRADGKECHKEKTREDMKAIKKARRVHAKSVGITKPPRRRLPGHRNHSLKCKVGGRTVLRATDKPIGEN